MRRRLPPDFDPLSVECDGDSIEAIAYAVAREAYRRGLEDAAQACMDKAERYAEAAREHDRREDVGEVGRSREWDAQRGARMCAHAIRALMPAELPEEGKADQGDPGGS